MLFGLTFGFGTFQHGFCSLFRLDTLAADLLLRVLKFVGLGFKVGFNLLELLLLGIEVGFHLLFVGRRGRRIVRDSIFGRVINLTNHRPRRRRWRFRNFRRRSTVLIDGKLHVLKSSDETLISVKEESQLVSTK